MTTVRTIVCCCLLLMGTAQLGLTQQEHVVAGNEADGHLAKRVEPVYPPIAKAARLQGKVTLSVLISRQGAVTDLKVLSGPPMLVGAATDAVKQWQYKPFLVDGKPAQVSTVVELPFSLGISEAAYKKEQEAADAYFKQEEKCRDPLLQQRHYEDAEKACTPLIELVAQMPAERRMERVTAYQYAGHAEFGCRKSGRASRKPRSS